jgi:hypothetical protein
MQLKDYLPCSQELANRPYSKPDESNPQPPTLSPKIIFC